MSQSNTQFDWSDFLSVGEELNTTNGNEASKRSAISRVYYAAHHAAKTYLSTTIGKTFPKTGECHREVISELMLMNHKRALGIKLNNLREKRTWADYNAEARNAASECALAIAWAKVIISGLSITDTQK